MVNKWTVYRHISPSGKVYIGITSKENVNKRWRYGTGYSSCIIFQNTINKYGWNNITHEVLFTDLIEDRAKNLEKDLIRHYKNLNISLNITDGGNGTLGRVFSKETILKMKNSHKGKVLSKSHRENMRIAQLKRTKYEISKTGKDNIKNGLLKYYKTHSSPRKGIVLSDEEKYKNMMSQKTRKSIIQYDLDMNFIAEFPSISYASKVTGLTLSRIAECCRGKTNKYKNYYWRYKDGK